MLLLRVDVLTTSVLIPVLIQQQLYILMYNAETRLLRFLDVIILSIAHVSVVCITARCKQSSSLHTTIQHSAVQHKYCVCSYYCVEPAVPARRCGWPSIIYND